MDVKQGSGSFAGREKPGCPVIKDGEYDKVISLFVGQRVSGAYAQGSLDNAGNGELRHLKEEVPIAGLQK